MDPEEIEARKYLGVHEQFAHCLNYILPQASEPIQHASYIPLWDQLQYGIALNKGAQKFYINKKTNSNRVFVPPKFLKIVQGDNPKYWKWVLLREWDKEVLLAMLINGSFLDVRGSVRTSLLSPNVLYLVAFVVMLIGNSSGWNVPVNLILKKPDGRVIESKVILEGKPIGEYFEVDAGELTLDNHGCRDNGMIEFGMFEHNTQGKSGLILKGVVVRSKASEGCPHGDA